MNEFYEYIMSERILRERLRPGWIEVLDYNFIDNKVIGGLLKTRSTLSEFLKAIMSKAKGNLAMSSTKDSTNAPGSNIQEGEQSTPTKEQPQRKLIIPKSPKITKPKPRVIPPPIVMDTTFKAKEVPVEQYKKVSLAKLEEEAKERKKKCEEEIKEKYKKEGEFHLRTNEIKFNLEEKRKEVNDKIESELQFNKKFVNPPKDFSKTPADVKYNEAAIIREEYLIEKKKKEDEEAMNKILIEKKDSKEYDRWVEEMKLKEDIEKMEKIQKRKIELEMNREVASNYMKQRIKQNQLKAAEHKKEEIKNMKIKQKEKEEDLNRKKGIVKEINQNKGIIQENKEKMKEKNQELYKKRQEEFNELNLIAIEEKKIEKKRRDDLIRQIRELEKIPVQRTKGFDPTETPGHGILEEMSLVELRERLDLQKKMLEDQIKAKKEENKLKMKERTDIMEEKAKTIMRQRDKLRNMKEVERKKKKDALQQKEDMIRRIREKNLIEVKNKIDAKKDALRKEDEIFQKKIREIKLQRQFLQQGRAAVEEKAHKQIEDGLERKINDRQNQELIDQQKIEAINVKNIFNNLIHSGMMLR
ncbi:MAG: hypothetical protein MJ252_08160 [archaeon]|nr:hypothetical protein [archaeon]